MSSLTFDRVPCPTHLVFLISDGTAFAELFDGTVFAELCGKSLEHPATMMEMRIIANIPIFNNLVLAIKTS
jgi:hypothetical protein